MPDEIKTHCRLAKDREALIVTPGNWAKVSGIEAMALVVRQAIRIG